MLTRLPAIQTSTHYTYKGTVDLAHRPGVGIMKRKKRCIFCGAWFCPYPRAWKTQKACAKKRCRARRREIARKHWLKKNPSCFTGLYIKTKLWLAKNPGYLRRYRSRNPDYVERNRQASRRRRAIFKRRRVDIQDGLRRREIEAIRIRCGVDIQDTLRLRLDGVLDLLAQPKRVDIQDALAPGAAAVIA